MVKKIFFIIFFFICSNLWAKKLNLIIVSVCSTNKEFFSPYSKNGSTPKLQSLKNDSLILNTSLSNNSWTSIFKHIRYYGDINKHLEKEGYEVIGMDLAFESRPRFNHHTQPIIKPTKEDSVKNYLSRIKKEVLKKHKKPFVLFLHLKDLHFPYTDKRVIQKMGQYFSKDKYDNFPRLPFFYHLYPGDRIREFFDDTWHKFRNDEELYGYIQTPAIMKGWMNHERYNQDLEILKSQYKRKVRELDLALYPLLNLYGNSKLKKDTLVLLTGDHGEAFMDHKILGHGAHVYEEFVSIPSILIHPNFKGQKYEGHYHTLQDLWYGLHSLLKGKIKRKNLSQFPSFIRKRDFILQHNCAGDIFTLRDQLGFKVIKFLKENRYEAYNLKDDKKEQKNLWDTLSKNQKNLWKGRIDKEVFQYFSRVKQRKGPLPKWTACFGDHWSNPLYQFKEEPQVDAKK